MAYIYQSASPGAIQAASIAQSLLWVTPASLAALVPVLSAVNLEDTDSRNGAAAAIDGLVPEAPYGIPPTIGAPSYRFSGSAEFPDDIFTGTFYVAAFRDGWSEILMSLRAILRNPGGSFAAETLRFVHSTLPYDNYLRTLTMFMTQLTKGIASYNWVMFEAAYSIFWAAPPAEPQRIPRPELRAPPPPGAVPKPR